MNMLGLDIGGANLKLADGLGYAQSIPFPLWQQPEQLPSALAQMLTQAPRSLFPCRDDHRRASRLF